MHRGSLGTRRRGKQRAVGGCGHRIGRNGDDDEGDGGGAEGFGGRNQEFGGVGRGDLWGQNPICDSKDYEEWLEQEWSEEAMEEESKELESEKVEYREFLKGLREKQVEEEPVVVENVEIEGEKDK